MKQFKTIAVWMTVAACMWASGSTRATVITWGTPTQITADTDVATSGALVTAVDLGDTSVGTTVVNTVPFTHSGNAGVSPTAFIEGYYIQPTFGSPATALSADYQELLDGGAYNTIPSITLSLSVTVNHSYLLQLWVDESHDTTDNQRTETVDGGPVVLDYNTTNAGGGLGQFVVGTFIADATSQNVTLNGAVPQLNAYQLRDLSIVPEPSTVLLLGLGGLLVWRRKSNA